MEPSTNAKPPPRKAKSPDVKPIPSKLSPKRMKIRIRNATVSNPNQHRQPSAKPGSRQDGPELALYAGLINEENDIDQQGHFGPWVRQHPRPSTRMLSVMRSGSRSTA